MNSRTSLYITISLLVLLLSIIWVTFSKGKNQEPARIFPAMVNRDCAPWDGSAFTVSIPFNDGTIDISIWQLPQIKSRVAFSLPDETGKVGSAYYRSQAESLGPLSGDVWFQSVQEPEPVEGEFDLYSVSGKHFDGKFKAEWGDQIVMCG